MIDTKRAEGLIRVVTLRNFEQSVKEIFATLNLDGYDSEDIVSFFDTKIKKGGHEFYENKTTASRS